MKAVSVLQSLYQAVSNLLTGNPQDSWSEFQEVPQMESVSQRQYLVSHIDDYCDCV